MSDNIVLIGYRGTGKSAVGNYIANQLDKQYLSTDEMIVDQVGSINDFVAKHSWTEFRAVEHDIIANLKATNAVIDCGGGVIETAENYKPLHDLGTIFWLTATPETIFERIKDSTERPALSDDDFLAEIPQVLARRIPLYKQFADFEVQTDDRTIAEIAKDIIDKI